MMARCCFTPSWLPEPCAVVLEQKKAFLTDLIILPVASKWEYMHMNICTYISLVRVHEEWGDIAWTRVVVKRGNRYVFLHLVSVLAVKHDVRFHGPCFHHRALQWCSARWGGRLHTQELVTRATESFYGGGRIINMRQ